MKQKIVILGAGKGGSSLLSLFKDDDDIEIIGIADKKGLNAPGINEANKMGVYTTKKPRELYTKKGINIIINVTDDSALHLEIIKYIESYSKDVEIIEGNSARFFWLQVEKREKQKRGYEALSDLRSMLASGRDTKDIFSEIVEKAVELIGIGRSELFVLDTFGEKIILKASTDYFLREKIKEIEKAISFSHGEGFTGWVLKTGKPLCVNDKRLLEKKIILDDKILEIISNNSKLNDENDREIEWKIECTDENICNNKCRHKVSINSYAAVPVFSSGGIIIGALRVSTHNCICIYKNSIKDDKLLDLYGELIEKRIIIPCKNVNYRGTLCKQYYCFDESIENENHFLKRIGDIDKCKFKREKALSIWNHCHETITKDDIKILNDLSTIASIALHNEKEKNLKGMLITLGSIYEKNRLFDWVVNQASKLIYSCGCSIFLLDKQEKNLELAYTSSDYLKGRSRNDAKKVENIILYPIDKGKTGLTARLNGTLTVNYYGKGKQDRKKLIEDYEKHFEKEFNLVEYLSEYDTNERKNIPVALLRVHRRKEIDQIESAGNISLKNTDFSPEEKKELKLFLEHKSYLYQEVNKPINEEYSETGQKIAKSYLALPINDTDNNLIGVLRIQRSTPGIIFTDEDVNYIESIGNKLTLILDKEKSFRTNTQILSEINSDINLSKDQNEILEHILKAITDNKKLKFEFATIQLVNEENNLIKTVMGRKNPGIQGALDPNSWINDEEFPSTHYLTPPDNKKRDIHSWVLMDHKEEIVIEDWNDHFDRNIYDKH